MVPYGLSFEIYELDGFQGATAPFEGRNFIDTNQAMECIDFTFDERFNFLRAEHDDGEGWASIKLWKTGGAMARGYWFNAGSGIHVTKTISTTFTSEHSESTTTS